MRTALLAMALFSVSPVLSSFAGEKCTCTHECMRQCEKGKGENCKCKSCDCKTKGQCGEGKCSNDEKVDK